jgi:DNA-binding GntR family transcriptional regulator
MVDNMDNKMVIEQPVPIRKQVYEHLRDQILNHTIEPSSRLVEAKIAKELGISRTPIREALHLLEKDGFVESIPRVGYTVKGLDQDELDEIFEIRLVIEKLVCIRAIEKIDAASIQQLEKNIAETEKALEDNTPHRFLDCDEEFHEILVKSAGSKLLFDLCLQLRRLMLRYRAASVKALPSLHSALEGHKRIVQCIKQKDATRLQTELIQHLNYSKEDIRKQAGALFEE